MNVDGANRWKRAQQFWTRRVVQGFGERKRKCEPKGARFPRQRMLRAPICRQDFARDLQDFGRYVDGLTKRTGRQ